MQLELQITFIIDFHCNKLYIMKNYVIKRWTMENSEYSVFKFIFIFCNNFEESWISLPGIFLGYNDINSIYIINLFMNY